ncbi:hypothetical protein [Streptomyces hydrogenans]|uniref:hypothetical protein n=1 Tax=Streptomyces hydrogenans TaxID=1873719 RepID=UPI0035D70A52
MSSEVTVSSGPNPTAGALRHVLGHLLTPLLMCLGMGLAYLGAFHAPEPHDLRVDIVGSGPTTQVLAQTLQDKAAGGLDVRTVPDRATAATALTRQDSYGAYIPGDHPELLVASASSDTSAMAVEKVFTRVAAGQDAPLKVTDLAPTASGDPTGQGVFFLLVAVSIGAYASVAVIGAAGAALPMRVRALLAAGTSLAVSLIGTLFAGPVFHLVDHGLAGVWALSWLYAAGILLIGIGLHTYLRRWTTLGVMVLFVMLNFTSSGGIYRPELQPGFFGSLHAFWNGAGLVEGIRGHVYFDGHGLGGNVLVLALWFLAGVLLVTLAGRTEARRTALTANRTATAPVHGQPERMKAAGAAHGDTTEEKEEGAEEEMEEEMEEAVAV